MQPLWLSYILQMFSLTYYLPFDFAYNFFDKLKLNKSISILCYTMLLVSCITVFLPWDYVLLFSVLYLLLFFFFFYSFAIKFDVWCEAGIMFQFRLKYNFSFSKHGGDDMQRTEKTRKEQLMHFISGWFNVESTVVLQFIWFSIRKQS